MGKLPLENTPELTPAPEPGGDNDVHQASAGGDALPQCVPSAGDDNSEAGASTAEPL